MFGVFIRRWKPKRASNDRNESPDESVSPEPPDRPPLKARQVHPEDKTQMLAYDATFWRKSKLKSLPLEEDDNQYINHLANSNLTPVYPLTPNICVEGGKIEFIKTPPESARNSMASPPSSPLFAARGKRDNRAYDEPPTEKFDGDKELLERRIKQLEQHLEEEKSRTQKEKLAVAKLQNKIIKREGQARSDAERERRARGDTEARARAAEADAARITAKLHAAQREISRMEETVRTLLQYKTRADTLKQEKSSLSAALEARSAHYQSQLSRLAGENETLRGQLLALSAGLEEAAGQDEGGDYERCLDDVAHQVVRALLSQKGLREELGCMRSKIRELEAQNKALSSLLVRQLLPQVRPSPASPESLASLAITQSAGHSPHRELQVQVVNYETGASCHSSPGSLPPPDSHLDHRVSSSGSLISFQDGNASPPPAPRAPHLSTEDKRRHQILAEIWTELKGLEVTPQNLAKALSAVDPSLWAPPERPITLNLNMPAPVLVSRCNHRKSKPAVVQVVDKAVEDEIVVESPESGNKDEGYSTMSSDVQADSSRQSEHNQELEDLKEASDETDNQTIVSIGNRDNRLVVMDDATDADGYIYFPVNVSLTGNVRNSYPPSKNILPFQHVMRSFSDSHLCLKFMTGGTPCGEHCFSIASPVPSSPGVLVFDLKPVMSQERNCINPLRRATARAALAGSEDGSERSSWPSTADERAEGSQYDAEYVQHWLKLDDTRSALQQRHRDVIDLEYDRAELEDWSLSLSCEDLRDTDVRRHSPFSEIATPGQISLSTLPSIREDNALELEEDVGECLWNECGFMTGDSEELKRDEELNSLDKHWGYSEMHSPGGSWSSAGDSDAPDGKRSSAALSEDGDCANVGLNFTRDFYRLVKYESTKSLASNSSRGVGLADAGNSHLRVQEVQTVAKQDRDQALQSVLNFIAEQQKYCRDREESDSLPSRPVSEIRELPPPYAPADFDEDSFGPRSEISEERRRPESCGSFSENDSCDIIVDERLASRYCQVSPDLKMIPRFIERDDSYTEVGNYYDFTRIENEENEIDERHLIKVHQKNEINKSIGLNNAANEIIANVLSYDSPVLPRIKMDEKLNDIATNRSTEHSSSALKENNVNIMAGLKHVSVNSDKVLTGAESMTKSSSFSFNSSEIEPTFIDEVLGVCRRSSSILVPVPEEEENLTENGSPQMTESNTTSTSTTETVIVPSKKENKNKSEKSRIPTFLGGKRPPCSPNRSKSKIPVPEHSKTAYGNSMITSETPVTIGPTVPPENIIVKQDHSLSFHEAATSKDVIDELNRMIQQNEKSISTVELENGTKNKAPSNKDSALWRPSGWVHVEKDIDFSDPKARANLLDVMLASSDSSPTSSCGGSSLSDSAEESAGYSRLHRLHRSRRQKKAAALRDRGMAVLRFSCYRRPSIIGRDDFFVRYGKQEQEAVASFDFLEQLSSGTTSMNSSAEETHIKSALENQVSQDSGKASQKSSELKYQESPVSEDSRAVTLSDSCHISYSGSDRSFEDNSS